MGWFIEYINGEIEVMVGCSSVAEEGDGYTGEAVTWSIFVKPQLSLKQRLKGSAADGVVQSLTQAVLGVLTANGIEVRHVGA